MMIVDPFISTVTNDLTHTQLKKGKVSSDSWCEAQKVLQQGQEADGKQTWHLQLGSKETCLLISLSLS